MFLPAPVGRASTTVGTFHLRVSDPHKGLVLWVSHPVTPMVYVFWLSAELLSQQRFREWRGAGFGTDSSSGAVPV